MKQTKTRYYLKHGDIFYGVLNLLGEEVMMSTRYQNEANVYFAEEVDIVVGKLADRGVKAKKIEVLDGHLKATRGRGTLHQVTE